MQKHALLWCPVLLAPPAQATRHEGSGRTLRNSTSLRATRHNCTHRMGRAVRPQPSQHTPSYSFTTSHLYTVAQGRTRKRFLISVEYLLLSHVTESFQTNKQRAPPGTGATNIIKTVWNSGLLTSKGLMGLSQSPDCPLLS